MVKPGGTGSPRLAISARLAPLPPSKSRKPALPSALPSPKVNTHLPDFTASVAALLALALPAGFGAGLAALFFSALRALTGDAALARAGLDGFDFAAIFLVFDATLAMTDNDPREQEGIGGLTPRWRGPAQGAGPVKASHVARITCCKDYMLKVLNKPRPAKPMKIR